MPILSLLLALNSAPPMQLSASCFDRAVVGSLVQQTYLGSAPAPDGEITLESLFQWDVRVQKAVIGKSSPKHFKLVVVSHARLVPWAARRVAMFLTYDDKGNATLVDFNLLDRDLARGDWNSAVIAMAAEAGLSRCQQPRTPRG